MPTEIEVVGDTACRKYANFLLWLGATVDLIELVYPCWTATGARIHVGDVKHDKQTNCKYCPCCGEMRRFWLLHLLVNGIIGLAHLICCNAIGCLIIGTCIFVPFAILYMTALVILGCIMVATIIQTILVYGIWGIAYGITTIILPVLLQQNTVLAIQGYVDGTGRAAECYTFGNCNN
jgi:hypothetical protein